MDGREKELNQVLLDYSSEEMKKIIALYTERVNKKKEEIKVFENELEDEKNKFKQLKKRIMSPRESAYSKLKKLSFVESLKSSPGIVKIYTKDLIVTFSGSKRSFGKYIISISKIDGVKARRIDGPFRGGLSGSAHHPFVTKYGNICFGNNEIQKKVEEWRRSGLHHLIASMVWDTLSNVYTSSRTYIQFASCGEPIGSGN